MKLMHDPKTLRSLMVNEATTALTEKPVKMTTLERIRLFTEADAQLPPDMPQPLKYGNGLTYVLDRISLPVAPYDLLMGRISEEVPDEEGEAYFQKICVQYQRRHLPWDKGTMPFWVYDQGHTSFYWKDVIDFGLSGLRDRAAVRLQHAHCSEEGQNVYDYLSGMVMVYDAIRHYLLRYAGVARQTGLPEAAEACENAANRAPETFREALQMLWGIMLIYCSMLAGNPTLTFGRLDLFLQPLYERDLSSGRLTREEAGLLILDFYCKNNLIMGRGEHQMSLGDELISTGWQRNLNFDAPQYLVLGGTRPEAEGGDAVSDLTMLFAEQVQPRFKNPVIVVRYAKDMMHDHAELWSVLVRKMRDSASMMVYNEQDVIQAYIRAGVDPQDARTFEHYGCNWPNIPGMDGGGCGHLDMWGQNITDEEWKALSGNQWTTDPGGLTGTFLSIFRQFSGDPQGAHTMEDFYTELRCRFANFLDMKYRHALLEREVLFRQRPGILLMMDLFFKDTVERAADYLCGGSQYYTLMNSYAGFATLVDCAVTVDALVYQQHKLSLAELAQAVDENFEDEPYIHALCRSVPKLGSDDALANEHGCKMMAMLTDTCMEVAEKYQQYNTEDSHIILRQSVESDTGHIRMGAELGATPDGRLAGMPLSQNSQPTIGASTNGLTAMLSSLASLPWNRIMSGAQNITIQPRLFQGEQGLALLASVLGTYFEMGGLQTQISAVDVEELRDAQRNPDRHRDLMVRITGYSAVFVDMSKEAQDDIIRREELGA